MAEPARRQPHFRAVAHLSPAQAAAMLPDNAEKAVCKPPLSAGQVLYIIYSTLLLVLLLAAIVLNFVAIWRKTFPSKAGPAPQLHIVSPKYHGYPRPI